MTYPTEDDANVILSSAFVTDDESPVADEPTKGSDAIGGPVEYESLLKDELEDLARTRGIDHSGTKAEIVKRLEAADRKSSGE